MVHVDGKSMKLNEDTTKIVDIFWNVIGIYEYIFFICHHKNMSCACVLYTHTYVSCKDLEVCWFLGILLLFELVRLSRFDGIIQN